MTYEELKNLVQYHITCYYDKSAPIISDAEFDQLYDKLEALEKKQGWRDHDSPTKKVGGNKGKVTHPFKLYSLRKVYDIEEVDAFMDVKLPKIDGTNLTLIYRYGSLKLALTRGNGEMGEDVTHLAKTIKNIPKTITNFDYVVINGECVTDNKVENYRNYVSGALGLKSADDFIDRNILFIAHDWLNIEMNYVARMKVVKNMGFFTVLEEKAWDYPKDGIVYRTDSYQKSKQLGYTSKYPKFAVALKERNVETAITTLQEVVWTVGRTGTVNPTGIVEPVTLEDAVITRVTLHNLEFIEKFNLGLGDLIQIERAGGVIPKFIKVVEHSKHDHKITLKSVEDFIGEKVFRKGPKLYTASQKGSSQKLTEHFIKTMEIKGLGPASVKKLDINHPIDIYRDTNAFGDLGVNGDKIIEEIERSKRKPYYRVLASLGIPGLGVTAAKKIIEKIPSFRNLRDIETTDIKGIGHATKDSILSWLDENEDWVEKLPLQLEYISNVNDITVSSKKVCITGKLDMTRNDLSQILSDKGFSVTTSVTKDCYALIAGDTTSSKYQKAEKLGVSIIDYWSNKKEVLAGNF